MPLPDLIKEPELPAPLSAMTEFTTILLTPTTNDAVPVTVAVAFWLTVICVGLSTETTYVPAGRFAWVIVMPWVIVAVEFMVTTFELAVVDPFTKDPVVS